jgi:hypothetical protein
MVMANTYYTWMYKESDIRAVHFLLDTIASLSKYMPPTVTTLDELRSGGGSWWIYYMWIAPGYKLVVGYDPRKITPADALEYIGLSPGDVILREGQPFFMLPTMPNPEQPMQLCGYRCNVYRPAIAGIDVFGCCEGCNCPHAGCSIGFIANKAGTNGIVSANHCLYGSVCNCFGFCCPYNKYVVQPSPLCGGTCPSNVIAHDAITYDFDGGTWYVDAAFAPATQPVQYAVLDEGGVIKPLPSTFRARDPTLGEPIIKFGRGIWTFSTRQSTVQGIGASVTVCCSPHGGLCRQFADQIVSGPGYVSPGDSGSGTYASDLSAAIGLNFAGNLATGEGVMARSVLVERYLGISLAVPSAPSLLAVLAGIAAAAGLGIGIVIGSTAPTR